MGAELENLRYDPGLSYKKFIANQMQIDCVDDTTFAVQDMIQRVIFKNPRGFYKELRCPEHYDDVIWLSEIMRQLVIDLNHLTGRLGDACACPEMTTVEDLTFVCAAHKKQQDCSALDYCAHTIDMFTGVLHNQKYFPSRLKIPKKSEQTLKSYARRLFRILAHAKHHHSDVWRQEPKWESWKVFLEKQNLTQ